MLCPEHERRGDSKNNKFLTLLITIIIVRVKEELGAAFFLTCMRDESLPLPSLLFLMHKFSFVSALGSFCSNCLFYF